MQGFYIRLLLICTLGFPFFHCANRQASDLGIPADTSITSEGTNDYPRTYTYPVGEFLFHLQYDTVHDNGYAKSDPEWHRSFDTEVLRVDVVRRDDQRFVQTLRPQGAGCYYLNTYSYDRALRVFDANFDGYPDVSLDNINGSYWFTRTWYLYDPKLEVFVLDSVLSSVNSPVIDPITHTFHSSWRIGMGEFGHATYLWENGEWVLIAEEIDENPLEDSIARTYFKVHNGKELEEFPDLALGSCYGMGLSHGSCGILERALAANPGLKTRLAAMPSRNIPGIRSAENKEFIFYVEIDTNLVNPDWNGRAIYDFDIDWVHVLRKPDKVHIQSFAPIGCDMIEINDYNGYTPTNLITLKDYNYDGYMDMRLPNMAMMYLYPATFYIWHPETQTFHYDSTLSATYSPEFDRKTKTVHQTWHIGVNEFGHEVYQWNGRKLELLARELQYTTFDEEGTAMSLDVRVNGKIVSMDELAKGYPHHMEGECDLLQRVMEIRKGER